MKRNDLNNGSKGKLNCRAQGKTGKKHQSQNLEKRSVKTEEATCKPLSGKVFYLDLPPNIISENLEKDIKAFGGTVEGFLSKDISYLISNKKEAKFAHSVRQFSPEGSPEPAQNARNSSPCPNIKRGSLDGSLQNTLVTARISRGKSLVEKAIKEQEIIPANSVLANALSWGVKVIHVDDVKRYIEQKKGCANIKKPAPVKEVGKGSNSQKVKSGRLKKPFVKVEDRSRHYRPFYLQLSSVPVVNYSVAKTCSPFDVDKKICAVQKQDQVILRNKTNTERESETQVLPNFKERKKKGYCECCLKKYEDLQSHVESEQHRTFAESAQYQVVDDLISKFPYDFVEYRNDKIKRMKCSTAAIIPIENVLKKDQLEERLNKVNVLLQQQTFKNISLPSMQEFESDEHPKETLNSSLQKPALISQTSPLHFCHMTFTSEVINGPQTCKAENHDSANGIISTSNWLKEVNPNRDHEGCMETLPNVYNDHNVVTNESKSLLDKNHLNDGDTAMTGYNSVTQAQVKDFSGSQKRTLKPSGRLSLKKRKVDGSLITSAKCCKIEEFDDCRVEKNVEGENSTMPEFENLPCGLSAKNTSFLLPSQDVENLDFDSVVCKSNSFELESQHLKGSFTVRDRGLDLNNSLKGASIFQESDFKTSAFDPVVPKISSTFILGAHQLKDHFTVCEERQILQNVAPNDVSSSFPAKDLHLSSFDPNGSKTENNIVGLQNLHFEEKCTDLQNSPVKESQFIFQANNFKADIHPMALTGLNSLGLRNCVSEENNTIHEMEHLQNTPVNIDLCSATDVSTSSEFRNKQMSERCTVHEMDHNIQNWTVNGSSFIFQANDFKTTDIDPAVSKISNSFGLENQMKEDCRVNELGQNLPQSHVKVPSLMVMVKDLKTSDCNPVFDSFSSNSELENHQTNVNCTVHEILQDLQNPSLNDGSYSSPTKTITKTDADPMVINIHSGSRLENYCKKDNCAFHRVGQDLQKSSKDASSIPKDVNLADVHSVGHKLPNNVDLENHKMKENGIVHKEEQDLQNSVKGVIHNIPGKDLQNLYLVVDKSYNCFILENPDLKCYNSPMKDTLLNFPAHHLQAPDIDLVIGKSTKNILLKNHNMKYNCPVHGEGHILHNSPVKDISFSSPANDLKMSCFERVASKMSNSFRLENHKSKENCTVYKINQVAPNSPLKDTSIILPQNILKTFELEKHHLKENCTIHELGQLLHISPVTDGVFIFRTKGLKALVSDSKGAITRFLLKNYPVRDSCTNHETRLVPHNSHVTEHIFDVSTDSMLPGKVLRKVKISSGRNKRRNQINNVGFCCQQANEMSSQQKDCSTSAFSVEHWLELLQTSEACSDFLGFAVYSEKDESCPKECGEEHCLTNSVECLLELFQTRESHSAFLGFSVYSEREGTHCSDDFWEEQSNSTHVDLLDLFQTSETRSDFLGFTCSSEIASTSVSNDCEERSGSTSIESLLESSKTIEPLSNSLGFTHYSAKENTSCLTSYCEEQSVSTPTESLLRLFQTSETRSEFFGFTSYAEQGGLCCPNDPVEDRGSIAPWSLFG